MGEGRKYTAYCGLYCRDCIPGNKHLFEIVTKLETTLEEVKFKEYANFKSKKSEVFNYYNKFIDVLKEIKKLECSGSCYEGPHSLLGCTLNCRIRMCVMEKEYEGCWECEESKKCDKLHKHKDFHPGVARNLEMIKVYGVEDWIENRGKHYKWS